ncbi:hypothetical protein [Leucobacter sp. cx-169]|uniref:hypothetical protein n=1 Tax=Leucobacter sp. cx-169 TaxID=2770549 RepID=UPI00165E9541|nr:hypothetical protein [Leucobacter sp. cx-169]MBC9927177.1 hypothetical protein [Leucobacter sp. cx-169]
MNAETVPDSAPDRFGSLSEAFQARQTSLVNREFLQHLIGHVPISEIVDLASYIKVVRADGGPDLRISAGYTNGFAAESEIRSRFPDAETWRSSARTGLWGVTHPENGMLNAAGRENGSQPARDLEPCPNCFILMDVTGVCARCE